MRNTVQPTCYDHTDCTCSISIREKIMADPNTDMAQASFGDLPILPTGSGAADLEVAYEQMKLAEDADVGETTAMAGVEAGSTAYDPFMTPTEEGSDAEQSAAHPS